MLIITGGSGFIGSALSWHLNQKGRSDLIIVDEFESSIKWQNLVKRTFHQVVHKNQLFSWLESSACPNKITGIVHLGACSDTTEKNMDFLLENNVNYSINLFRYATKNKIPFIYASSAATYGAGEKGYLDDPSVMDQLKPINPYGFSKKLFDSWVLRQTEKPPLFIGLKFFNVYGPNEGHKDHMQSVVAKAVPQILQTGRLKLFKSYKDGIGHGEQQRDFIYIKDVVEVLGDLIEKAERKSAEVSSGIYNLGTGVPRSFADLGCAVFAALEKQTNFEWIEMPERLRDQYQYYTKADLTRLFSKTNLKKTFTSLEKGVYDYVRNYLIQKDSYL